MINNNVFHGDCLEIMKEFPDQSIDMILCDLPYGITGCKWDSMISLDELWNHYHRIIKKNGAIVLTGQQPFTSYLIMSNVENFKYSLVWEKSRASNFVHAKFQPLKAHEDILVFSLSGAAQGSKCPMKYFPQKTAGKPYNKGFGHKSIESLSGGLTEYKTKELRNDSGDRYPRSVIYFPTSERDGQYHPTQKPIALFEYLIKTYTNEHDVVLDNCAGSGTTGIAATNTNRKFVLIENDSKYYDIILSRLSKHNIEIS